MLKLQKLNFGRKLPTCPCLLQGIAKFPIGQSFTPHKLHFTSHILHFTLFTIHHLLFTKTVFQVSQFTFQVLRFHFSRANHRETHCLEF